MVSSQSRIGIIGAGSSGVYLAILLIQQGFQVTLFEKAPHPRTDGCGILIVQAGMEALHQGNPQISQKIINSGAPVKLFEFRNLRDDVINSEPVTYEENELPGMLVHRKAILEALLESYPLTLFVLMLNYCRSPKPSIARSPTLKMAVTGKEIC